MLESFLLSIFQVLLTWFGQPFVASCHPVFLTSPCAVSSLSPSLYASQFMDCICRTPLDWSKQSSIVSTGILILLFSSHVPRLIHLFTAQVFVESLLCVRCGVRPETITLTCVLLLFPGEYFVVARYTVSILHGQPTQLAPSRTTKHS